MNIQIEKMSPEEKRAYMLLKAVVFFYHGLDENERRDLEETATELDAHNELKWAYEFIRRDYFTSFDRAREYLSKIIGDYEHSKRVNFIDMVWKANNMKGYVTELEATAMLKFAKDWNVEKELIALVKQ